MEVSLAELLGICVSMLILLLFVIILLFKHVKLSDIIEYIKDIDIRKIFHFKDNTSSNILNSNNTKNSNNAVNSNNTIHIHQNNIYYINDLAANNEGGKLSLYGDILV